MLLMSFFTRCSPELLKLNDAADSHNRTVSTPMVHEGFAPRAESVPEKHIIITGSHI